MESEWPFTARRSEMESLASGAVAVGEAGAGKCRLLREAARRAGGGLVTVAAEPSVPFGAFAHHDPASHRRVLAVLAFLRSAGTR
ncbi:hypothetical protein [Nonomuraea turcica]|uniref:hypothetical protein n=1 Tax=Nonomuraea sp. G32 TaxID=3067274 RepID=UPI00273A80CE|nr:hypothetical protein [Nonomuraea sp. G32]MDP4506841.1 hypothetical protein [Nonomuraea sp. G32]